MIDDTINLTWSASAGIASYNVYDAFAPHDEYQLLGTTTATHWTAPLSGSCGFYYVTAVD